MSAPPRVSKGMKVWWEVVVSGWGLYIGCGNKEFTSCDVSGAWEGVGMCANSYCFHVYYNSASCWWHHFYETSGLRNNTFVHTTVLLCVVSKLESYTKWELLADAYLCSLFDRFTFIELICNENYLKEVNPIFLRWRWRSEKEKDRSRSFWYLLLWVCTLQTWEKEIILCHAKITTNAHNKYDANWNETLQLPKWKVLVRWAVRYGACTKYFIHFMFVRSTLNTHG